ncbi:hypothetical protein [Nitrosomonas sp.]|uniref:hypothetical protein n=1 Tax=Nitrosomonas sp. TaxID=42353 RepID=UPI00261308CD|nr:hypothetical protein [Nitrosomonas sp.]
MRHCEAVNNETLKRVPSRITCGWRRLIALPIDRQISMQAVHVCNDSSAALIDRKNKFMGMIVIQGRLSRCMAERTKIIQ